MGLNESGGGNLTPQQDSDSNSPDTGAKVIHLRRSRTISFPQIIPCLNCQPIFSISQTK